MPEEPTSLEPIQPPADVPEIQRGNWLALPARSSLVEHIEETLWDRRERPVSWEVARLSSAAYIYRETSTDWAVVAKFYAVKTGSSAHDYAARERDRIQRVQALGVAGDETRPVIPLAVWRGVLFLEYVRGLTLENIIAVRRSQPGRLNEALDLAALSLVRLHSHSLQPKEQPDFDDSVTYVRDVVHELGKYGVLQDYPVTRDGLQHLIDRWAVKPKMRDLVPSLIHGDATTTNFVFPEDNGVVVVDWERLYPGDPAADLGRLMAEVTHSINQHGGNVAGAEPFVKQIADAYGRALPEGWDRAGLIHRAHFYRASSTLRIARNGWVSRLDRTALVAQAMALLAD